jgi:rare lipoprotein A
MHLLPLKLAACSIVALLLASCSSSPPQPAVPLKPGAGMSGPEDFSRPHKDGAPWWDVDVSRIKDAVPRPHYGRFKASPYTVLGKTYYPIHDAPNYKASGTASWYGTKFHGQATANGEAYDLYGMTAAHKTLPLPSYVRVTRLDNGKSVVLRVNDRGPFYSDRIIDLSFAAAKKLGYAESGTARVKVEGIDPEQWWKQQGRPVPSMLAGPQLAKVPSPTAKAPAATPELGTAVEQYSPPAQQHAAALLPLQVASTANPAGGGPGLYLQVAAFANPDAAQLLKDKLSETVNTTVFINSVVLNQQILHRVRLGPISTRSEVRRVQDSIRLAKLGESTVVHAE